jgi:hypothetical protein
MAAAVARVAGETDSPYSMKAQLLGPRYLLDLAPDDLGMRERGRSLKEVRGPEAHGRSRLYLTGRQGTTFGGLGERPRLGYAEYVASLLRPSHRRVVPCESLR